MITSSGLEMDLINKFCKDSNFINRVAHWFMHILRLDSRTCTFRVVSTCSESGYRSITVLWQLRYLINVHLAAERRDQTTS